jgi:hypothetical protein
MSARRCTTLPRGTPIDSGHHVAEENPVALAEAPGEHVGG